MAALRTAGALVAAVIVAVLLGHAPVGAQGYTGDATCSISPLNPSPGDSVTATGTGFAPGSEVTFTIEPDGFAAGVATANAEGVAVLTFTLPTDFPLGAHTVVCSGVGVDGEDIEVTTTIDVVSGTAANNPPTANDGTGNDNLARTGIDVWTIARIGLLLFALGAALYLITRKRQRNVSTV